MAADVLFTAEDPWYTNSASWRQILEAAMGGLRGAAREEYVGYACAPPGIDFTALPDGKAAEVAGRLCGAVETALADQAWKDPASRAHLRELARKLRSEIRLRVPAGGVLPPDGVRR